MGQFLQVLWSFLRDVLLLTFNKQRTNETMKLQEISSVQRPTYMFQLKFLQITPIHISN